MDEIRRSAVIDVGSNSVRLVVVESDDAGRWRVIDEDRAILRLGETLASSGRLSDALETARFVYASLVRRAEQMGCQDLVAIGTAALRAAPDGAAFAAALARAAGVPVRIVDGADEARLGFLGMIQTLDVAEGNLVDLGGASTEVSYFNERRLRRAASAEVGAVTLWRLFAADPPSKSALQAAHQIAQSALEKAMPAPQRGLPLVAIGGSFRAIAKLHRHRVGYPFASLHNYRLDPSAIEELCEQVAQLPLARRQRLPGLAEHRAETIVAALVLARAVCRWLAPREIVVSGTGLREGVFFDRVLPGWVGEQGDVFWRGVENLLFQVGETSDQSLVECVRPLLGLFAPLLVRPQAEQLCLAAATLRGIGRRVNFYDRHRQTFNLIAGARLFGLGHREQLIVAAAASYESPRRVKERLHPYEPLLVRDDVLLAQRIGLLVAFSDALRHTFALQRPRFAVQIDAQRIELKIFAAAQPPVIPFDEMGRLARQFPKAFGRRLDWRCVG